MIAQPRVSELSPGIEIIEIVVIEGDARRVLVHHGRENHPRRHGDMQRGQLSGQEAHAIVGVERLLAAQQQRARFPVHRGEAFRHVPRRAVAQLPAVPGKAVPLRERRPDRLGQGCLLAGVVRQRRAVFLAQPAVRRPRHLLDRRFAAQRAAQLRQQRPRAQVNGERLPVRAVHHTHVTGLLQRHSGIVELAQLIRLQLVGHLLPGAGGENGVLRVALIRPPDRLRPPHGGAVVIARAALGADDVVILPAAVQMRPLHPAALCPAIPDAARVVKQLFLPGGILGQADRAGLVIALPALPVKREQPFPAVPVVEERGVEAVRLQVDRLAPGAGDLFGRDEEVVNVHPLGRHAAIDDIEQILLFVVAQIRRPDPLPGGEHAEAQLRFVGEDMGDELPVLEIPRMVDGDPGEPRERGYGEGIIVPLASDARIGVKAW